MLIVAKRYIMMVSLANCYAKYVFFKIFALLFSSGGFMQRQMSPTEGLVKVVKVKMKKSVSARNEFDNFDNYDRFV